jgi:hypothetical protein
MTGDGLAALVRDVGPYDTPFAARVRRAVAEIHRLRELVKAAEWAEREPGQCSWCGGPFGDRGAHTADCPAFLENGDVR